MRVIYLVDDDADDRFLIREAIQQIDDSVTIIEAENGMDLLVKIDLENPARVSLILLDMNMPKMNGLETIGYIKKRPGLAGVPLVMITTSGQDVAREQALKAGCDLFLIKPLTFDQFVEMAKNLKNRFEL